ncbi:MAG: hypothetical protein DLM67_00570 [Candidatus Nephthysia bennettiae]|nr:MAG: hypothetical protein DLM67_00570 [Candidatus Dormibacteraeota bacterium]
MRPERRCSMRRAVLDSSAELFGRPRAARPWLSVVIPAYNEERRLPATLERVLDYLRPRGDPFEVIVVDDGSSDETSAVARAAGSEVRVVEIPHTGKGGAVRAGVLASRGELVLVTDADLPTPIDDLRQLIVEVESGSGLAVGSRRLASSSIEVEQPIHRRVMGKVFSLLVQLLVLRGVQDTQCGFKLFRGELAREVFSLAQVDGFAFDVEAILLARQLGARVSEVPVRWYDGPQSHVRAVRDSLAMFVELLAIRRRSRGARRLPTGLAVLGRSRAAAEPAPEARSPELARIFWLALAAYLAAGAFLVIHEHLLAGDTYSRVAIAHRILFSRDPHLAAIGFVWSPLPILALLPLVPLSSIWPSLTTDAFSASIVSAVCMAAAAREVAAFLRDMEVRRRDRWLLTLAFAAHPLVVLYAANGMSEAMFLLFLLMAARRLAGWLRTGNLALGTGAALALGAAYLARYEALAAAGATVGLVALSTYRRSPGSVRQRFGQAMCDTAMIAGPVTVVFASLALASWAITGNPVEQITSAYGNSAQLRVWSSSSAPPGAAAYMALAGGQVLILEPFIVLVTALAVLRAWMYGSRAATLAVVGMVGGAFTFMFWSNAHGAVDHQLRYLITAVPLSVLAAGSALARGAVRPNRRAQVRRVAARAGVPGLPGLLRRRAPLVVGAATLLMVGFALPVSAYEMMSPAFNPSESVVIRASVGAQTPAERKAMQRFRTERQIAADLDALELPPGTVLVDDFLGFAVPLNSQNPRQFAITSDRDFQAVLADPGGASVRYVLVPEPTNLGLLDAVNRQYPKLYASGGGMATLVKEYANQSDVPPAHWRLYELLPETGG